MKIACYTCITGGYDTVSKIAPGQGPDVDFICFTDDPMLQYTCRNWSVRPIPAELAHLSKVKQQRVVKACPHRYLGEYDATLWVDGNIDVNCDVVKFAKGYDLTNAPVWTRKHPARDCIYEEAKAVLRLKKDVRANVDPQMEKYRNESFPKKFGLFETCIILRVNSPETQVFGNMWAREIMEGSHRDQLSFDYCRWKTGTEVGALKVGSLLKDENFRWRRHGK